MKENIIFGPFKNFRTESIEESIKELWNIKAKPDLFDVYSHLIYWTINDDADHALHKWIQIIEFKGMHIDSKLRMKNFKEYSMKTSKVAEYEITNKISMRSLYNIVNEWK